MKSFVTIESSKENSKEVLLVHREDQKRYIHSRYRPSEEAALWARETAEQGKDSSYIIFGGGLLYHVEALLEILNAKAEVLVVEPDKAIYDLVSSLPQFERLVQDKRFSFFCMEKEELFEECFLPLVEIMDTHKIKPVFFSPYETLYPKEYLAMVQCIMKRVVSEEVYVNSNERHAVIHMDNLLTNLYTMCQSAFAMCLRNRFVNRPAVVVSAGPSLDKNVDQLKEYQDKVLIIVGGRTLKPLLDRGIRPHLVVSMDPSYESFQLVEQNLDSDVPMLASFLSNKEVVKQYKGEKFFLNNSGVSKIDQFFFGQHIDTIGVRGTVAIMQMNIAQYMGCTNIALIGQDLAFTDYKFHSDTANLLPDEHGGHNSLSPNDKGIRWVKGNLEERVPTDMLLSVYIDDFEKYVADIGDRAVIYNCTEGGAYIEGTCVTNLQTFLEEHCSQDFPIASELKQLMGQYKNNNSIQEIRAKYQKLEDLSYNVVLQAEEAIKIMERIIKTGSESKRDIKRLKSIDKDIKRFSEKFDVLQTLGPQLMRDFGHIEIDAQNEEERKDQIRRQHRAFYIIVFRVYTKLKEILEEVILSLTWDVDTMESRKQSYREGIWFGYK